MSLNGLIPSSTPPKPAASAPIAASRAAPDGLIEVQGDDVATVMAARVLLGYAMKRSGG